LTIITITVSGSAANISIIISSTFHSSTFREERERSLEEGKRGMEEKRGRIGKDRGEGKRGIE
jgi:hypothetical protein